MLVMAPAISSGNSGTTIVVNSTKPSTVLLPTFIVSTIREGTYRVKLFCFIIPTPSDAISS